MAVLDHPRLRLGLVVIGSRARRMCVRRLAAIAVVVIHAGLRFGRRVIMGRRAWWMHMAPGTISRCGA